MVTWKLRRTLREFQKSPENSMNQIIRCTDVEKVWQTRDQHVESAWIIHQHNQQSTHPFLALHWTHWCNAKIDWKQCIATRISSLRQYQAPTPPTTFPTPLLERTFKNNKNSSFNMPSLQFLPPSFAILSFFPSTRGSLQCFQSLVWPLSKTVLGDLAVSLSSVDNTYVSSNKSSRLLDPDHLFFRRE